MKVRASHPPLSEHKNEPVTTQVSATMWMKGRTENPKHNFTAISVVPPCHNTKFTFHSLSLELQLLQLRKQRSGCNSWDLLVKQSDCLKEGKMGVFFWRSFSVGL